MCRYIDLLDVSVVVVVSHNQSVHVAERISASKIFLTVFPDVLWQIVGSRRVEVSDGVVCVLASI